MRSPDGQPEYLIFQTVDINAEVQARENLKASEERNRVLAAGLQSELSSAAR
jgi:hypothetical protein